MSEFTGWINKWAIVITIICVSFVFGASSSAMDLDYQRYEEVTKPLSMHDEIYDRLITLDEKLERIEATVSEAGEKGVGIEITKIEGKLIRAKELRDRAEVERDKSEFGKADVSITKAREVLEEIMGMGQSLYWLLWLMVGLASVVLVGFLVYFLSFRGKVKKIN